MAGVRDDGPDRRRAGRGRRRAEPIWAAVRADTPDDVWVYNNAGLEYAAAGEHQTALEWLTAGLRLAIETGDRYRLVDQLAEQREESMFALRLADDELQARALAFAEEQSRADEARRTALDAARRTAREPEPDIARGGPGPVREVAWVWLPADEYERGLQAWPDLREDELINRPEGRISHAENCLELQRRLRDAAEAGMTHIKIAPVRPAGFAAWCAERGEEPGRASRANYAAELARLHDPSPISWPAGRNEPCWCGSRRKYKKCCAAPR